MTVASQRQKIDDLMDKASESLARTAYFEAERMAQTIFDKIPYSTYEKACAVPGKALLCKPLKIDWTFYCHKCDGMASLRTCPHGKEDRVILSGTMLRKLLSEGGEIPDHFGRDEVLAILRQYYEGLTEKVEIKLHGAATGAAT